MMILRNTSLITPAARYALAVIAAAVALSSINVQAASASKFLPETPVAVTEMSVADDTAAPATLVVPKAETPVVKKSAKRVWNTVNAPDLETQAEHSTEPPARTITVPVSAYTSAVEECDSSPFTTADGSRVRDGIVAANFLKHGTRFRIPAYFGDKVFEVHDRMNARYSYKIDIWMTTKTEARAWGVRTVKVEILP
ncbi:MAG: hypothetical protein V1745_00070 [Patescibacteria group bacterium]